MKREFEKRGIPTDQYETWIYEGTAHALHDERRIDSAAAVFCARMIQRSVFVSEDTHRTENIGPWLILDLQGSVVGQVDALNDLLPFADGVYAAVASKHRTILCVCGGRISQQQN